MSLADGTPQWTGHVQWAPVPWLQDREHPHTPHIPVGRAKRCGQGTSGTAAVRTLSVVVLKP